MTGGERFQLTTDLRALAKFFGKSLDDDTIADYVDALGDLDYAGIGPALSRIRSESRWFPKPVDIRRAAKAAEPSSGAPWSPPRYELDTEGVRVRVYECVRCEDSGWRPACGCNVGHMGVWQTAGECPDHPRVIHGTTYRQAVVACECRASNRTWQASRPRPNTPTEDAA